MISFHPYGTQALLINFEQKIDPAINARAIQLSSKLENVPFKGITFCIPAYCSLTIGFDPNVINFGELVAKIKALMQNIEKEEKTILSRLLEIPVCYELPYALDLAEIASQTGLTKKEIVAKHCNQVYQVYILGFLPGFAYMGKLPEELFCKRKKTPRLRVPELSVGLAGFQTGIYPAEAPGGWQIIGATPFSIFDSSKKNPFLFRAGDQVKFYPISEREYDKKRKANII